MPWAPLSVILYGEFHTAEFCFILGTRVVFSGQDLSSVSQCAISTLWTSYLL